MPDIITGDMHAGRLAVCRLDSTGCRLLLSRECRESPLHECINGLLHEAYERFGATVDTGSFVLTWNQQLDTAALRAHTVLQHIHTISHADALASAIGHLSSHEHQLTRLRNPDGSRPPRKNHAPRAVLELTDPPGARYHYTQPSGAIHLEFSPRTEEEHALAHFMNYPTYARLLSAKGLASIYTFLSTIREEENSITRLLAQMPRENLAAAVITYQTQSETCREAVDHFLECYARLAQHLALTLLPHGGLYLGGSLTLQLLDKLKKPPFMKRLTTHPTAGELLRSIPIYAVTEKNAPLIGAALSRTGADSS